MNLQEIIDATFERSKTFNPRLLLPALRAADNDAYGGAIWDDVMNVNGCFNYIFSACLMDVLKPTQVVELGGAMGVWAICCLQTLPAESTLYSITLPEDGKEFMFVVDTYPNFRPIVGDDLDLSNWSAQAQRDLKAIDLSKTDVWYFDSLHTYEQLTKELELYSPFFKKGALLLFDDVHQNEGMEKAWEEIQAKYETKDLTDPCHFTGWAIAIV